MEDYTMDFRVIAKLLDIEAKILESYQILFVLEEIPTSKAKKELERIKVLIKKENILLNQLPKNSYILGYICNLVCQNSQNFFEDDEISAKVLSRFTIVMNDLTNIMYDKEDEEIFEDEDLEIDNIDKASTRVNIRDNIIVKYIKCLDSLIHKNGDELKLFRCCQFNESFHYKNVGDFILNKNFETNKITFRKDDEMAKTLNLDIDDYNDIKNDELFNMTQEVFFLLLSCALQAENDDVDTRIVTDSLKLRFFLREMSTPLLLAFDDYVSNDVKKSEGNNKYFDDIYRFVADEVKTRKDIPVQKKEINPSVTPVDAKTVDGLISLIKIEEKMLLLFDNIDFDDINNRIDIQNLESLVSLEKSIVKEINITYNNAEVIEKMLTNDLDFFLIEEPEERQMRKKELIYERIHDILPFYRKLESSPIQSQVSYSCISQNHIVSTLKLYEKLIEDTEDENKKRYLQEFYRELFFVNVGLLDDFIYAGGNYKMIDCFNDILSSQSIGLSEVEYAFDKDEQLYEYAKFLIEEILSYEDAWEEDLNIWAVFEFKLSELNDIINNVSDEHFYELPYLVKENNTYNSSKTKKRILKAIKKNGNH